jgi:sterol 3beta-glucosyltransferase
VHHGGSGTTAAGLRAGKPSLICPFLGDQPFWGERVYQLGAGPKPIKQKKLTVETMATAVSQMVNTPAMQQSAAAIGARLRAEDGITNAIHFVEKIAADYENAPLVP